MVTDLAEVRRLAEAKEAENLAFRRYLKAHHCPDEPFHQIAEAAEAAMDCRACANCCRQTRVALSHRDADVLAHHLAMPVERLLRHYACADTGGADQPLLRHVDDHCIFLEGNLCQVYEARPRACRDFPHLAGGEHPLKHRMEAVCQRAWFCPIVYNTLEEFKNRIGFHVRISGEGHPSEADA